MYTVCPRGGSVPACCPLIGSALLGHMCASSTLTCPFSQLHLPSSVFLSHVCFAFASSTFGSSADPQGKYDFPWPSSTIWDRRLLTVHGILSWLPMCPSDRISQCGSLQSQTFGIWTYKSGRRHRGVTMVGQRQRGSNVV